MHRNGSGQRFPDIQTSRKEWIAAGRTISTFPSKSEWEAWEEDTGELVEAYEDGTEIRQHATLKAHSRGGTRKIIHNCVIFGNPKKYAEWLAEKEERDKLPAAERSWMASWTYNHSNKLENILNRHRKYSTSISTEETA